MMIHTTGDLNKGNNTHIHTHTQTFKCTHFFSSFLFSFFDFLFSYTHATIIFDLISKKLFYMINFEHLQSPPTHSLLFKKKKNLLQLIK